MEDINAIKIYIKNNYPNVNLIENNNFLLITNDSKIYKKINKKLKKKLKAKEINEYLTEFTLKSHKIFTDMYKFSKFIEYKDLWEQFLIFYPSHKKSSEIIVNTWNWEYNDKTEILIDIQSYADNNLYGAIFKNKEIMYIIDDEVIIIHDNIDKNLIKRTQSFNHIRIFECDGNSNSYYSKEKNVHQHCLGIIDYSENNTEYYEEEPDPKTLKIPFYNEMRPELFEEEDEEEYELQVAPYDMINNIYREVRHGFLVKEIDEEVCCYKKVVNSQEVEISDADKILCKSLGITYRRF